MDSSKLQELNKTFSKLKSIKHAVQGMSMPPLMTDSVMPLTCIYENKKD